MAAIYAFETWGDVASRRKPDITLAAVNVGVERKARVAFDIHWRLEHSLRDLGFCHNFGTRGAGQSQRPKGLVVRIGGGLLQPVACKLIDFP